MQPPRESGFFAVRPQLIAYCLYIQPELARRCCFVISCFFQGSQDQFFFRLGGIGSRRHGDLQSRIVHWVPDVSRKMRQFDPSALGQYHSPLNEIPQFPDVAWPRVVLQSFQDFQAEAFHAALMLPVPFADENAEPIGGCLPCVHEARAAPP